MMEPTSFAKLLGTVFIPSLGITTSIQPFIWHFSKRSFSFDLSPRDHPLICPQGITLSPRDHPRGMCPVLWRKRGLRRFVEG
jgi:hypothetical protein